MEEMIVNADGWSEPFVIKGTSVLTHQWTISVNLPENKYREMRSGLSAKSFRSNLRSDIKPTKAEIEKLYYEAVAKRDQGTQENMSTKTGDRLSNWDLYDLALSTEGIDRILVYGPPGVGKTHAANMFFRDQGIDYEQVTATEGDMVSEYRGMWVPAGDKFDWFHGLLVRGWTANDGEGMPIIVNEVDKFPMECMSIMHAILDNPNIATLTLPNGERVKPGPKFRFIGTMNGVPGDLSEALQSRFQVKINIDRPHQKAIDLLDDDVKPVAEQLILADDSSQRVNYRQLLTFKEIRGSIGDEKAAQLIFGHRGKDLLGALKFAT